MKICLACAEFQEGTELGQCSSCGGELVADSHEHRERLIERRVQRLVQQWRDSGVVDAATAVRIRGELGKPKGSATAGAAGQAPHLPAAERRRERKRREQEERQRHQQESERRAAEKRERAAKEERRRAERLEHEAKARHEAEEKKARAAAASMEAAKRSEKAEVSAAAAVVAASAVVASGDSPAPPSSASPEAAAVETGQALFAQNEGLSAGLTSLAALDDEKGGARAEALASVREYVWWFIGSLLVVAGSIMGVREAWLSLAGPSRQILVAGALLAYHAGFVGLAALINRRSARAGGILGAIAVGIVPVAFVALSSLAALAPGLAAAAALPCAGISYFTLRAAGRLFGSFPAGRLPLLLLPLLLSELPLAALSAGSLARVALSFVGIGALVAATRPPLEDGGRVPYPGLLAAALYAALWGLTLALIGAPDARDLFGGLTSPELSLWVASLAAVLTAVCERSQVRARYPRAAPALDVLGLAVAASTVIGATVAGLNVGAPPPQVVVACGAVGVAGSLFALALQRHGSALHLLVLCGAAAGALLSRLVFLQPAWWVTGSVLAPVAALLYATARDDERRTPLLWWGTILGVALIALCLTQEAPSLLPGRPLLATATAAALLAAAAHLAGRRLPALDYLGGVAALSSAAAYLLPLQSAGQRSLMWTQILLCAAASYGALGWILQRDSAEDLLPLDDLSLGAALAGTLLAASCCPQLSGFVLSAQWQPRSAALPLALLALGGGVLLLRALREHSRVLPFLGFAALGLASVFASGAATAAQLALVFAGLSVVATLLPALPPRDPSERTSRPLLGLLSLPWPARGVTLYADGLAAGALVAVLVSASQLVGWLSARVEPERTLAIVAGLVLVGTALLGFLTSGWGLLKLRGSLLTLSAGGALVALTAVVNRIGRPLPPAVVGRNLSAVVLLVWLAALGLRRIGPWLGRRLGKPAAGPHYHIVPLCGVGALGLLLAIDAYLVGSPGATPSLYIVPPMLCVGAALASGLLARSTRQVGLLYGALLLLIPCTALSFAQRAVLGPALVPLDPPGARWVRLGTESLGRFRYLKDAAAFLLPGETLARLWERATFGLALLCCGLCVVALALTRTGRRGARLLLDTDSEPAAEEVLTAFRICGAIAGTLVALLLANQPRVLPAALLVLAGVALFTPAGMRAHAGLGWFVGTSALLVIHAIAHLGPTVPVWTGPALALASVVVVAVRGSGASGRLLFGFSLIYALAAGAATDRESAMIGLLAGMSAGLVGGWAQSFSLSATLALLAVGRLVVASAANQVQSERAARQAAASLALLALSGSTALVVLWQRLALVAGRGMSLALLFAALAALAQLIIRSPRGRQLADVARGLGWGRDGLLVAAAVSVAVVLRSAGSAQPIVLPLGLATLGLGALVAAHAAYCERTARHIYLAQIAAVGLYGLLRVQVATSLGAQADACFALVFGFVLVGVVAVARRAGIPPLQQATRRFAALLPVGIALLLPSQASGQAALFAGGSSLLYTTLAVVERSRLFGALGALLANLALLISALAWNMQGSEIYLAPLGLLILMLAQIFGPTISRGTRHVLQAVGGVLIYLPSAIDLTQRLGAPGSGGYAVLFGALCLLGVAAGMVLHIRSYLILGALFLSLDVAVNLLNIGLRDHRIGFWLLSLTGLSILGAMVLTTLRRSELRRLTGRLRRYFRSWD